MDDYTEISIVLDPVAPSADLVERAREILEHHVGEDVVIEVTGFGPYGEPQATRVSLRTYVRQEVVSVVDMDYLQAELGTLTLGDCLLHLHLQKISDQDWTTAWRQHYQPIRLSNGLVIAPTWTTPETRMTDRVIWLDPGMAFGTGTHPSTRLILDLLPRYLVSEKSVLDVGTGSGILAIAALKLGAGHVVATDIDAQAIDIARQNLTLNQVADRATCLVGSVPPTGRFSLVCANILADVLADLILHQALGERLEPGGFLLLSGIIAPRLHVVELALLARDMRVIDSIRHEDWVVVVAQHALRGV